VTEVHRPPRRKRRLGGVGIAIGLVMAMVFDPARRASVEQLDRQKRLPKSDEALDQ
jgi:hypothetical protein